MFATNLYQIVIITASIALVASIQNPCKRGQDGFFAFPGDESKFIQCSSFGEMFEFNCPPNLIWNQALVSCRLRSNSESQNIASPVQAKTSTPPTTSEINHVVTTKSMTTSDGFLQIVTKKVEAVPAVENDLKTDMQAMEQTAQQTIQTVPEAKKSTKLELPEDKIQKSILQKLVEERLPELMTTQTLAQQKLNQQKPPQLQTPTANMQQSIKQIQQTMQQFMQAPKQALMQPSQRAFMPQFQAAAPQQMPPTMQQPFMPMFQQQLSNQQMMFKPVSQPLPQHQLKFLSTSSLKEKSTPVELKVNLCDQIKCPTNLVCGKRRDCPDCNPMCFHKDKISFEHAVFISCDNVLCPSQFKCLMDDKNVTKCVKNADEVIDSAVTSGMDQSKTVLNQTRDLPTRSKPVEISCEFVTCPTNMICIAQKNLNPICSAVMPDIMKAGVSFQNVIRVDCSNVVCPNSMKCQLNDSTKMLMCQ